MAGGELRPEASQLGGGHNIGRDQTIPESSEGQICNPAPGVGGAPVPRAGVTSLSVEVKERRSLPSVVHDGGGAAGSEEGENTHHAGGVAPAAAVNTASDIVSCFVKLSGLVWSATEADIRSFLSDCSIKSVSVCRDGRGRATGEAVVEVAGVEGEGRALAHHGQRLGSRWVTVAR